MFNNKETKWLLADKRIEFPLHHSDPDENHFCAHRGTSMNPTLTYRDLLEIKPYSKNKIRVGDVILFMPPQEDHYFVHRIVKINVKGVWTRGDNNNQLDPWLLRNEDIYGRVITAHRGEARRKIANGFMGRLTGMVCQIRRSALSLLATILGPVYRSLCTSGFLHWLVPIRFTPQVATYRSGSNDSLKLLLGKRAIGFYDHGLMQWQIRRPYRILIDESSLPTP